MTKEYVYKGHHKYKNSNSKIQKLLLILLNIPILNKISMSFFKKAFNMPASTSVAKGFYCSAPLLKLGENVSLGDTRIIAWAPIIIGNNTTLSFGNTIITSTHALDDFNVVIGKQVTIGQHCWITTNCTILAGVTVGDNTIIGAGSVVTRDIPSGVFAAGNPCKVIKKIVFK